ncbi:DUF1709-domain-containing protein [Glonium stellatum]|uniref:DUF1709-domain-containing protein n=1 Tax=Glonium stellatum TaxID=574774 RepID=A0A8E2JXK5_9PEZI|nr:DUF1709-domain-containing protein [Glonium stellatum]
MKDMPSEGVPPLRINKTTPSSSPSKMSGSAFQRPLSEIGSTERRRNSPSFNQATKKKMMLTRDSSPFDSSPFNNSPRLFWKERDPTSPGRFGSENDFDRDHTLSPKRSSIENLKKASRVKNSSMFAREQKNEYDPTSVPVVERPLAAGRPLSVQVQGNAFGGRGLDGLRKQNEDFKGHRRGESLSKIPLLSPSKPLAKASVASPQSSSPAREQASASPSKEQASPSKEQPSPTKSSLSSNGRFSAIGQAYDPESSIWSEDEDQFKHQTPRPLRRHAKSVTFDAAPPTINEYEMVTPDPSSVASGSREGSFDSGDEFDESFDRGSSMDRDDSFDASLEDTDKTPVVLPEDWRHMSPEVANTSLADTFEDPFDGREISPTPNAGPNGAATADARRASGTSDGESRPLPPLPGMQSSSNRSKRDSSVGLSATAERVSSAQRSLPLPPRAAGVSKSDILNMRDPSMSLEDRLRLMGLEDRNTDTPTQESHNESFSTLKSAKKELGLGIQVHEDSVDDVDMSELEDYKAPRISRESILRRVKSRNFDEYDYDYSSHTSSPERSYGDLADLDPDVPIPSREGSSNFDTEVPDITAKGESDGDSVVDAYSMAEMYSPERSPSRMDDYDQETSVIHHRLDEESEEDDDASQYSTQPVEEEEDQQKSNSTTESDGPPTPKPEAYLAPKPESKEEIEQKHSNLPDFGSFLGDDEFNLKLESYMSPSTANVPKPSSNKPTLPTEAVHELLPRPSTPEEQLRLPKFPGQGFDEEEEPGTPDSVIRHPVIEPPERDSPAVPEPIATIKAPGAGLKTRASLAPSDTASMAAARRQVSGEHPPPIPERSPNRLSMSLEISNGSDVESGEENSDGSNKENLKRRESNRMKLDIPVSGISDDLSFGLDKEFDRVIEAQKKGYLMRQNTKVVVASSRQFSDEQPPMSPTGEGPTPAAKGTRSAGSSPRKGSAERKPAWTTEPWNGKVRRKSVRQASGGPRRAANGPAPPLPGQESNVQAGLSTVVEGQQMAGEDPDDGTERGRLFVKVVGVKDLDMPLPRTEQTWFQLTLDNGLHCVTTSWLELGRNAPIGQEFELVVLNDLEFQLTLQTKLEVPPQPQLVYASPAKVVNHKKSASAFSRLLASPKKRKEQERKLQEENERAAQKHQQELQAKRASQQPTAWDLLHDLVGPDGSFARAYVCLKNHENQAYGRPFEIDVPCFNEWAVDDSGVSSVKSKRGGVVRRPPYRIAKLSLQLLYIPKPKGAKDEDMPKSMNACIRELKEAEETKERSWEGHLSQQGGDCPYWRRRFFRLNGTKLTAYHESTRQPRATINLAKASKLIDDRSALTEPSSSKNGGRRKSAFAEEEEGYMFVEEGFRIRFANGEVIDFYADNAEQKAGWMKVLSETVGKDVGGTKAWTEMVLEKERKEKNQAPQLAQAKALREQGGQHRPRSQPQPNERASSKSAPSSPQKWSQREAQQPPPPPIEKDLRHTSPRRTARRDQVRSMIF